MGFLSEFTRYLRRRTDAPPEFHLHAGMAALSIAAGNRVWCDGWGRELYPNIWVVLLAPSGYGKSVPLDMCTSLLHKAGLGNAILPSSFSQEALMAHLAKMPIGLFAIQEFSAFLSMLNRDYNSGAEQALTELFDVPDVFQRILRSESIRLERPYLTILGASSPEWFAEKFKANMLRGGFLARFLFCPSRTAGEYVEHPGPRDDSIEIPLAGHLRKVSEQVGKADFKAVMPRFNAWDREKRLALRRDCPPEFSGMRSRAGMLVLKTAMLFRLSDDPEGLDVQKDHLEHAIDYVEKAHAMAEQYLTEEVAHNPADADRLRLLELLRRANGRMTWSKALKDSHMSADFFRKAVDTLEQSERIRVTGNGRANARELVLTDELRVVA